MKTLFVLNEAPYGSERSYNALRRAGSLCRADGEEVRGITDAELIEGARRGTLAELTAWTQWADQVIVF